MSKNVAAVIAIVFVSACASQAGPQFAVQSGPAGAFGQPDQLLTHARSVEAKDGCDAAATAYRVIASFGKGHEVAQFELGDCLLEIDGTSEYQTALNRDEAVFWLKRAALAGNANAQNRLAHVLSGAAPSSETGVIAAPVEAMGWAFIYAQNGARELYGLPPVAPTVMAHLDETLSSTQLAQARQFADRFQIEFMEAFSPPAQAVRQSRGGDAQPSERRRRRQ